MIHYIFSCFLLTPLNIFQEDLPLKEKKFSTFNPFKTIEITSLPIPNHRLKFPPYFPPTLHHLKTSNPLLPLASSTSEKSSSAENKTSLPEKPDKIAIEKYIPQKPIDEPLESPLSLTEQNQSKETSLSLTEDTTTLAIEQESTPHIEIPTTLDSQKERLNGLTQRSNIAIHFDHCSLVFNQTTNEIKDQPNTSTPPIEKISKLEPHHDISLNSLETQAPNNPAFISTVSLSSEPLQVQQKNQSAITFSTEILYWQIIQDHLLASIKANGIHQGNVSSLAWVDQHFNYDPGFRVGLGGILPYDQWHLSATYTFLRTSSSQHSTDSNPEYYMILSGHMQSLAEQVKSSWQMHFQSLDIMLGRLFSVSDSLKIKPQMGIKGAYPKQQWHVSYIHPVIHQNELIFLNQRIQNFFWGVGPNLGLDLSWTLPKSWALQIKPSWSLLLSKIYSTVIYSEIANQNIQSNTTVKGTQQVIVLIPQMELWLGAEWTHTFHQNRYFQINFGYDVQYFWNEANILAFVQLPQGSLMLHGATIGFNFGY